MAETNNKQIRFGTEGWRGVIARDFTFENISKTAAVIAGNMLPGHQNVVIGYDNRFLSEMFAQKISDIFGKYCKSVVISDAPVTTPNLCYSTKLQTRSIGIMITASHNPPEYNGLKIKSGSGGPVPDWYNKQIEEKLNSFNSDFAGGPCKTGLLESEKKNIREEYINYIKNTVDISRIKKIRGAIIIDALYGPAGYYFNSIFKGQKNILLLRDNRDPLFGGIHPEPVEKNLILTRQQVLKSSAFAGIAVDGDGDRLGVIDEKGNYLPPHIVFPLLVNYALKHKNKTGMIVQTISLGYLTRRIAQKYNVPVEETPIGFKYISAVMQSGNVFAGGEESGGYSVCSGIPDRDGILSGLLFLEILSLNKNISSLVKELKKEFGESEFLRRDIRIKEVIYDKKIFSTAISNLIPEKINTKITRTLFNNDGLKVTFKDDSWLLMRPSGTEPLVRIYAETETLKDTNGLLDFGEKTVKKYLRGGS